MHRFPHFALLALLMGCNAGSSGGAAAPAAPAGEGQVLATVNGRSITTSDFDTAAARKLPPSNPDLTEEQRKELIDGLIRDELLAQHALEQGLAHDPAVRRALITALLKQQVYKDAAGEPVNEAEARAYFEQNKDEFTVPEKIQIRRMLIRPEGDETMPQARERASELLLQVRKEPETFRELARRHSKDVYAQRGGDMGFVSREGKPGVPEEVINQAFTLDVGQVSEIFEAEGGWNFVQVINRRERIERTFEQMRAAVERKMRTMKQQQVYDEYVQSLRKKAKVNVDEAALGSHSWDPPKVPGPLDGRGPLSPLPGGSAKLKPAAPAPGGN